jgi:hypothetical protein
LSLERELFLSLSWFFFLFWIFIGIRNKGYSFDLIGILSFLWFDFGWLSFLPKKGKGIDFSFFYRVVFLVFSFSFIAFMVIYLKALYSYKWIKLFLKSVFYVSFVSLVSIFIPIKPFFLGNVIASYVGGYKKVLVSRKVRMFFLILAFLFSLFLKREIFSFADKVVSLLGNVLDK